MVDLYQVTQGCDEATSLTSLSWCNSRGVNSTHHCRYTMASAGSKFDDFCLQYGKPYKSKVYEITTGDPEIDRYG